MLSTLQSHIRPLLLMMLVLLVIDITFRAALLKRVISPKDLIANMTSWGVETLTRNAVFPLRYGLFVWAATWVEWTVSSSIWEWVTAYILVDLAYYWKHRWLHNNGLLWSLHKPHHSIRVLTADSALRLGWIQRLFDDFFYLPLVLFGFSPWTLLMAVEINHIYQWWCHCEWIGRIPLLDRWLNTPSNHRLHHSSDEQEVRHNYGSTFMIWDHLFGTYQPEPDTPITFGVKTGYVGSNPFLFQLVPVFLYLRATVQSLRKVNAMTMTDNTTSQLENNGLPSNSTQTLQYGTLSPNRSPSPRPSTKSKETAIPAKANMPIGLPVSTIKPTKKPALRGTTQERPRR